MLYSFMRISSCCASGITAALTAGAPLERVQLWAAHADLRTTRLHDKDTSALAQAEIERIAYEIEPDNDYAA